MDDSSRVRVNVYATLRQFVGGRPSVETDVVPGTLVADVLKSLEIPVEKTRIVFINHRAADLSHPLNGGETVGVFPAVGGG